MLDVGTLPREMTVIEIEKMLVLSTGHLTKVTAALLNDAAEEDPPFCTLEWGPAFARDEGWLFYVPPITENGEPDDPEGAPEDLTRVFMLAREHGCMWVMLDCDGPQVEGLPYQTW